VKSKESRRLENRPLFFARSLTQCSDDTNNIKHDERMGFLNRRKSREKRGRAPHKEAATWR
jgi:hypothetical protein